MKKIIFSENAAKPIGPYSQAVAGDGKLLFISDTIPLLKDGSVAPNNIEAQTRQVLENIKAVLTEAGLTFKHIVKTTVFLQDLNDFGKMNEVYAEYFTEGFPARTAIQVSRIPKDVLIGMEAVAVFEL